MSCFFDISRAYDQIWHAKLLQKLQKTGISGKMYDYIKTFLSGRSMQVRWKGAMSAVKTVSMGVPQGSVIAPLFFNIMTGKVAIAMYADDLAIWLDTHIRRLYLEKSRVVKKFMNLFQAVVDGVVWFMRENGFTLSSPKTIFIPFHTNNLLNQQLHVKINEECILASNQIPECDVQPPRVDPSTSRQHREERFGGEVGSRICVEEDQKNESTVRCS